MRSPCFFLKRNCLLYVNFRVKLKERQVLLGTIIDQSEEKMILKPIVGAEIILSMDQIDEAIPQDQSIMLEHLTNHLSEQEIRDLFAYIGQK